MDALHPVAQELLNVFGDTDFFRSDRLCETLAASAPERCLTWAVSLVEPHITRSTPHVVVAETLDAVRALVRSPDTRQLPKLDELAWRSWSSGSFDGNSPYLQKAIARLGWATIGYVCIATSSGFESDYTDLSTDADDDTAFNVMVYQCASAIDMTTTTTRDGRLLVASEFTRRMQALS